MYQISVIFQGDLPSKAIECCDLKSRRIFTKKKKMHLVLLLIFPCLVLHFILIRANLKTSHSLGCNFCCTLMFQLSTSMHWAISSPTSVNELVCRRLLIRALLLFPLKNPFRPSTAFCLIFLWRTSKPPVEIFIFR